MQQSEPIVQQDKPYLKASGNVSLYAHCIHLDMLYLYNHAHCILLYVHFACVCVYWLEYHM